MGMYNVVFICYLANYYWEVTGDLNLEDAEIKANELNKKEKIHKYNGCCHYLVQKNN